MFHEAILKIKVTRFYGPQCIYLFQKLTYRSDPSPDFARDGSNDAVLCKDVRLKG